MVRLSEIDLMRGDPNYFDHNNEPFFCVNGPHAGRIVYLISDTWYGEHSCHQTSLCQTLPAHALDTRACLSSVTF